jgi:3D-(3,5/4)-trihydroxycyclohexane-1,2-dione acylhydrolase (decyclizing)
MFDERDWVIRRPVPDPDEVDAVARLFAAAEKPLIIAGGGVIYSGATSELAELADAAGVPVAETFAGKGAVQQRAWWQLGGIGLEGTPATNELAAEADFVLTVGSRLTDFATASQSLFANPDVRFASINVDGPDAGRLGATAIVADAKRGLAALITAVQDSSIKSPEEWQRQVRDRNEQWLAERAAALDPDTAFDKSAVPADSDVVTATDAVLTQGQIIGLLQEHAQPGDTIIAAAGGPPGDLQKVWDATERRYCHLEFGFSCMGYEIPAGLGVRLAVPDRSKRVLSFIGDGTFLMAPTELVTALQEQLQVTVVISENHGYQAIHRLQMWRSGQEFGNEFRYREDALTLGDGQTVDKPARLEGEYLQVDLVKLASGLGAVAIRATTPGEVRDALSDTRDHDGPVVIVIPAIPHAELPAAGVWWDVAPAEVSDSESVARVRADYEAGLASQRWFG